MAFFGLFRSRRHERAGYALYTEAVQVARDPALYAVLGVPDTLDGRFDMIGLHVSLVMNRLRREASPGPELAQAVFDAMFSDMDFNLREMGVSDMAVGKRVKAMWEALNGRAQAYAAAFGRFRTVLDELVAELPELRKPMAEDPRVRGPVARRMVAACGPLSSRARTAWRIG